MRVRLMTAEGGSFELPPPLAYRLRWTGREPCDDMEVTVPFDGKLGEMLPRANRFAAYEGDELLLKGVVDQWETTVEPGGRTLTVSGRGMLALLLDNEAPPAFYQWVGAEELARIHAEPYGIDCRVEGSPKPVEDYRVEAGASRWRAICGFARYGSGLEPRMTREGTLIVGGEGTGRTVNLSGWPVLACQRRERRHGVISRVTVKDKRSGVERTVVNRNLEDRGGRAERIVYAPRKSTWAAMRYTGEYQIEKSREGSRVIRLALAGSADVRPGDRVQLDYAPLGIAGKFRAAAVERALDEKGLTTVVTLWE